MAQRAVVWTCVFALSALAGCGGRDVPVIGAWPVDAAAPVDVAGALSGPDAEDAAAVADAALGGPVDANGSEVVAACIPAQCDDANPCTDDGCLADKCAHVSNTSACDDGNACTTNDLCQDGKCAGAPSDGPPAVASPQAYLKASNFGNGDWFGSAIAIDGDTMVVGAPFEDSDAKGVNGNQTSDSAALSGAAYVFMRKAGVWKQQAYLKASDADWHDRFGACVAVSGDTVAVGAPYASATYVFVRKGDAWTQQDSMLPSGCPCALSGDTLVVGTSIYERSAGIWTQTSSLSGGDSWGGIAISGDTIVLGSVVFERQGAGWSQKVALKSLASDAGMQSTGSVAISGSRIVVIGQPANAAYVFLREGEVWKQEALLKAENANPGAGFGTSVAISGATIVVGAIGEASKATGVGGDPLDKSAPESGAAYIFGLQAGAWTQKAYLKASNTSAWAHFGVSVAVSGVTVMVGADEEDGIKSAFASDLALDSGAVYAFGLNAGCDDNNPCTDDACSAGSCLHTANAAPCDDGNACTVDSCTAGTCVHAPAPDGSGCGSSQACAAATCTPFSPPPGMALIPAGTFWMGCNASNDGNCGSKEVPQHKVTLSAYEIDQLETTVAQYQTCVAAGACTPAVGSSGKPCPWAKAGDDANPATCLTWAQARAYCTWRGAGYDLPTEAQWEMAARGTCEMNGSTASDPDCKTKMRVFPASDVAVHCDLAVMWEGPMWDVFGPISVKPGCGMDGPWPGGSKPAGDSPYGLHDMAGNVWEWTRDAYAPYTAGDATDPDFSAGGAVERVARGGSFLDIDSFMRAAYRGPWTPPPYWDGWLAPNPSWWDNGDVGVRCVRSFP